MKRKAAPDPEVVVWDGDNGADVFDLATRVAGLGCWSPLPEGASIRAEIHDPDELHPGLNIIRSDGTVVARVEQGNALVFDLFREPPLFALQPDELAAFYEDD